jgi:hypothetical protein
VVNFTENKRCCLCFCFYRMQNNEAMAVGNIYLSFGFIAITEELLEFGGILCKNAHIHCLWIIVSKSTIINVATMTDCLVMSVKCSM